MNISDHFVWSKALNKLSSEVVLLGTLLITFFLSILKRYTNKQAIKSRKNFTKLITKLMKIYQLWSKNLQHVFSQRDQMKILP